MFRGRLLCFAYPGVAEQAVLCEGVDEGRWTFQIGPCQEGDDVQHEAAEEKNGSCVLEAVHG